MIPENIQKKIAEVELYWAQGLCDEAQNLCHDLLDQNTDPEIKTTLERLAASMHTAPATATKAQEPQNSEEQFAACQGLIEAGFFPEAMEQLEIIAESGYEPGLVHAKLGECCLQQNNPFAAQEHFEQALAIDGLTKENKLDIMDRLALVYENTGSIPAAIKTIEQIVKIDNSFRNASQRLHTLTRYAQKAGRFFALINDNILSIDTLDKAKDLAKQKNKLIETILIEDFDIDKTAIGKSFSSFYDCPFVEFDEQDAGVAPDCIKGVKEQFFRANCFIPLAQDGGKITVAVDNPHDLVKNDNIESILQNNIIVFNVALQEDINKFIDYYFGKYNFSEPQEEEGEGVFEQLELEYDDEDEEELEVEQHADGVVVQMANKIIEDGIIANASDIHIESQLGTKGIQVRYRIDGECRHYRNIPFNYKRSLVSRLKILSKMDISERRLPQDGKIKFKTRSGRKIELRAATLPTTGGNEDIVLRILASSSAMPLDKAGILTHNLENFKKLIEMPYGLIAVVGPTGSGKTTTLHAALRYINRPEKKIWTVEDPVEIVQDGLRQVQVQNKIDLTFARVLKAFLRADPDIIMVGETRDKETANTVIEASLTGHLVFTTLHTNSAPETITRLTGIGIDPFTFADALLGVLAQRLVKRLCPKCKTAYTPDKQEQEAIMEAYGDHPLAPLEQQNILNATMFTTGSCSACKKSGFSGRLGIHELLATNEEIKQLISQGNTVAEIREAAMRNGMRTLMQDAVLKTMQGDTSFNHARAACIK